jgi:hypothetical protein
MTNRLGRLDWPALGVSVGAAVLFTLLWLAPMLLGAHGGWWLAGLVLGIALGVYLYVRRDRYQEPGPDADEQRFPP